MGWLFVGLLLGFLTGRARPLRAPSHPTPTGEEPGRRDDDSDILDVDLDQVVARGEVQSRSARDGAGGRAEAVMFVRCAPERVRRILSDFDAYPDMVDDVTAVDVYERSEGLVAVDVHFRVLFLRLRNALVHELGDSCITWRLDDRNGSSTLFVVNSGRWSWRAHADGTLLFYQARILPRFWTPGALLDRVCAYGSEVAVGWVRRVVETSGRHREPAARVAEPPRAAGEPLRVAGEPPRWSPPRWSPPRWLRCCTEQRVRAPVRETRRDE